MHMSTTEQRMLNVLQDVGSFTLDALPALCEMSWAQVFLAVDRLSRSRQVTLHRTHSFEYVVSIGTVA
jgi:hypothetical protein